MSLTVNDLLRAAELVKAIPRPPYSQVVCNERMMPDARAVAPPREAAFMGMPVRVNNNVPDGYLVLVNERGEVVGVVGPNKTETGAKNGRSQR